MITGSSAIVLCSFPYSESSVICKAYTREHGLNSFLLKGARSPKSRQKLAVLRPLQAVEMVHYRGRSDLHLIKEMRIEYPMFDVASNPEKSCIALFLSELLFKSINDNVVDHRLYDFLRSSVEWLELTDKYLNFHIQFMLQLSRYLGFYPRAAGSFDQSYFGEMQLSGTRTELNEILNRFIEQPDYSAEPIKVSNTQRRELLNGITSFYARQLEKPLDIKSLPVLESIFSD